MEEWESLANESTTGLSVLMREEKSMGQRKWCHGAAYA